MSMAGPAYCTVADTVTLVTAFNSGGTFGDINTAIVQLAIGQASAEVSAWTGQIWGTDETGASVAVPDLIQSITLNIAAYYATLSYRKNKPVEDNDPVLLRYNSAMANLKAIQEGEIDANPVTPNKPVSSPGRVINTNPPTFTPYDSGTTLEPDGRVRPETYPSSGTPGGLWQ
jgi:Protein of unknown function (DUF1320)